MSVHVFLSSYVQHIIIENINGIQWITLNRPEKRNALNAEVVQELHQTIEQADQNPEVRVIVLKANGKVFCAGADLAYLQQISQYSPMENLQDSASLKNMFQAFVQCSKPIVGMVHGAAIAGGCGLASVCDIVVADETNAMFGYSEVRIGFIPAIVLVYLVRKIGDTQARKLLLTAENISAQEAHRIGLISVLAPSHELVAETTRVANVLAANSGSALALTKHMLNAVGGMSVDAGLQYATTMNALARQTDDFKQGIAQFLQPSSR